MYETNEYPATATTYRSGTSRRAYIAKGAAIGAVLVALALIVYAFQGHGDEPLPAVGAASTPTASPAVEPTEEPDGTGEATGSGGGGDSGGNGSGSGSGSGNGSGSGSGSGNGSGSGSGSGESEGGGEEPEEPEPPAAPLEITASIDTVSPGGQCFASGTIAVDGGEYPLTVHYQWRALVIAGGLDGDPVSPVHNVVFSEPGAAGVQTSALPEDGTNVFLVVSGPEQAGSGLFAYDGCSDGPGGITTGE